MSTQPTAAAAGTIDVGGDLTVNRMGFGAMRITGSGIWGDPPSRDQAIATLRAQGETVVCALPGHGSEIDEFHCDRELIEHAGQWQVQATQ